MTTENRLTKKVAAASKMNALDWHRLAVAKGLREAAAAWFRRAQEEGLINSDGKMRSAGE